NLRHAYPRAKASRAGVAGLAPRRRHLELRDSSPEHSADSRDARYCEKLVRDTRGIRQRAVLRLGFRESRAPAAHSGAARCFAGRDSRRAAAARRKNSRRVRCAGLLREISKALHGWVGTQAYAHCAEWRRASVSRRSCDSRPFVRECEESRPRGNLGALGGVPEIPRRRVDAGTLPLLRAPRTGFRRLP